MYDYIIVGAGSAGCVLANRLTEDSSVNVLLLEAGRPDRSPLTRIPLAASLLYKGPFDWAFATEPQPALNERRLYFARGKGLGGSSAINSMIHIRGAPQDYDHWATLGNPGWSYAEVLPYFKKLEHEERATLHASPAHGTGGPLHVADPRYTSPLTRAFLAAAVAAGYPRNEDFNGAMQEGVGFYQLTQKRGQRHSAAAAYLQPIRRRRNLTVLTEARVIRLLIEGDRVAGVAFLRRGQHQEMHAQREVLLCGGAIQSPQLLLVSGVGPADHLQALQIPVVRDLPGVGQNLRDHVAAGVMCACTRPISITRAVAPWNLPGNLLRYALFHRGPFTSNVLESGGFVRSLPDLPLPDLQLNFLPVWVLNHGLTRLKGHGFILVALLLRPESRGRVTLRSSDPLDAPRIQPNYLADERDQVALLRGLHLVRQITTTAPLAQLRQTERLPGDGAQSDDELLAAIRTYAENGDHPVGTARMGRDALAVVDERLRVHGLQGVRVVDASIMPTIPGGNTNTPTIMIAERAADLIKADQP
jgi:choline dehydrogenase